MQTIMIVEDDPDIRDGVRILLSGEGYRCLLYTSDAADD